MNQDEMRLLIERAEQLGHWLHCTYQDIWFSPSELKTEQAKGRFMWGAVNWKVRDPREHLTQLEAKAAEALRAVEAFKARMETEAAVKVSA